MHVYVLSICVLMWLSSAKFPIPYKNNLIFNYSSGCFAFTNICAPYPYLVTAKSRRGYQNPGTGVTETCVQPCGCQELNLSPLQKVLITSEPVLKAPVFLVPIPPSFSFLLPCLSFFLSFRTKSHYVSLATLELFV